MGVGFDVWLMGFARDAPDPVGSLQDAFGLDKKRAKRLVDSLPKVVKRGLAQGSAMKYAEALRALGATVEVRATVRAAELPPNSLPKITGFDPSEDEAVHEQIRRGTASGSVPRGTKPSGGMPRTTKASGGMPRATLGDGPEGTRDVRMGKIVSGGDAPYAWLTYSLMAWIRFLGGAAILALMFWLRGNAFTEKVGLVDMGLTCIGGLLATSGLIEGVYGAIHRRERSTILPVAFLWLLLVVGVQFALGNPLFAPP